MYMAVPRLAGQRPFFLLDPNDLADPPRQVLAAGVIPTTDHDVWIDLIVTPDEVIRPRRRERRLAGSVRWEELTEEKLASIPFLAAMRRRPV